MLSFHFCPLATTKIMSVCNFFQIISSLRMVQEYVENQKPSLQPAMIPIKTAHLTLLVMHLASEEDIEK